MPLLKDFLLDINKTLSIPGIEALSGASDIATIEIDDETMDKTKAKLGSLMTIDAAQNNADIDKFFKNKHYGAIKGELLGNIDTDLMNSAKTILGEDSLNQFKEIEFTGDKIKKFTELAQIQIESKEGGDEKIKLLNTNLNKQIAEGKLASDKIVKDHEKELKKLNTGHNSDLINMEFDLAINQYTLGDKYTADEWMKPSLHENIRKQVKAITTLTLSEDKKVIPKNPADASMALYVDGKEINTLKDVLDPLMKDFIKVNNVDPNRKKDGNYVPAKEVKLSTQVQHLQQRKKETFSF